MMEMPSGLAVGGASLWAGITENHELDPQQYALLENACRQKDRADYCAKVLEADPGEAGTMRQERDASVTMARLLAAMRLPDTQTGRKPQARNIRGAYGAQTPMSALERARRAAG